MASTQSARPDAACKTTRRVQNQPYRILSLDGGGAKGFYTLGVLRELERALDMRLCDAFDLIYGTSTGGIIAGLLAIGRSVDDIHVLYKRHITEIMRARSAKRKTEALARLTQKVFGAKKFDAVKTGLGIIATRWVTERPMIFRAAQNLAAQQPVTVEAGFGIRLADAVQASCSAYPYFETKCVWTKAGDCIELVDGGYCANNPTLYALADATEVLGIPRTQIRVVSVGVGVYPLPKPNLFGRIEAWFARRLVKADLLQKSFEFNTQSIDHLRAKLFADVPTIRISDTYQQPEMATDLFEHDAQKLNILHQRGKDSFAERAPALAALLGHRRPGKL